MKSLFEMNLAEFTKYVQFNTNFHRFEGLDNRKSVYLFGVQECYSVLVEAFDLHPNRYKFAAEDRLKHIPIGSEADFIEIFDLTANGDFLLTLEKVDLNESFWQGVEDVFNLYQFLCKYEHPKVMNGYVVEQHPSFKNCLWSSFTVVITDQINAQNCEGPFLKESIENFTRKESVYLDEIFGLLSVAEGYFLTIKKG